MNAPLPDGSKSSTLNLHVVLRLAIEVEVNPRHEMAQMVDCFQRSWLQIWTTGTLGDERVE